MKLDALSAQKYIKHVTKKIAKFDIKNDKAKTLTFFMTASL